MNGLRQVIKDLEDTVRDKDNQRVNEIDALRVETKEREVFLADSHRAAISTLHQEREAIEARHMQKLADWTRRDMS